MRQQRRSDPLALAIRIDVEMVQHVVPQRGKARDPFAVVGHPHLLVAHDPSEELAILAGRMESREERQAAERAPEERRDRVGVVRAGTADPHRPNVRA